jgi:hypothetical protein
MLRAQIAMRLDDAALGNAPIEQLRRVAQNGSLPRVDPLDRVRLQNAGKPQELFPVGGHVGFEAKAVFALSRLDRGSVPIEPGKPVGQAIDVLGRGGAVLERAVEHPVGIHPMHLDEPVDRKTRAGE